MQSDIYELLREGSEYELIVVSDEREAKSALEVAKFLGYDGFMLPDFRANFGDDLRAFKGELFELLDALANFYNSKKSKKVLITPFRSIIHNLPTAKLLQKKRLEFASTLNIASLKEELFWWGYSFVEIVQEEGEVSFRGDIIDIYPRGAKEPFRISLFDDEIESIRSFDPATQKSKKDEIESIELPPAYFSLDKEGYERISECIESVESDAFVSDIGSLGFWCLGEDSRFLPDEFKAVSTKRAFKEMEEYFSIQESSQKERFLNLPLVPEAKEFKDIEAVELNSFLTFHKSKKISIIVASEALLKQYEISDEIVFKHIKAPHIVNIMSKDELILSLNREQKKRRRRKSSLVLDELSVGSYVVHENYGIGIFKGLKSIEVLGSTKDFVEIAYQNDDKLLVPVENIDLIDRYISDGGNLAVVDRLGKGSFAKLKEKTRAKLFEIAKEIIEIAAERELKDAPVIRSDFEELALFRAEAGFEYTEDQQRSIDEIFDELSGGKVMDRLLSGDVGFGKTEVAMNAILATVKSGYQAALIAPTTLLVSQHYKTISERLAKFGVKIAKLDRFTSAKEKREIITGLEKGEIDLCIATHSLLGVKIKNLAFLVIDEEHKFGVKQKEALKQLRANIHILSMSATPIPRSLNMALSSIKSYSQLLTPPSDREDVRTFVKEYDEKLLKEVILRERRRGGQLFYIHNRIASIESKRDEILEIVPDLKILVLHSKVPPATTEKEILRFEEGEYDLLLSTSIVESGIHMPNVNTIIVEGADRFGMADLHQLRGRVGRGSRQGYCYYIVEKKEALTEEAIKRLVALESNSFLGAGAVLAYHDLEIRGGGNLVGEAQSGHIKGIGYSLYIKMLEDAIHTLLHGSSKEKSKDVEIKLAISAYLSSELIGDDRVRLELYRRFGKAKEVSEVYELQEEIEDRFGEVDEPSKNFIETVVVKILSRAAGIKSVMSYGVNVTFVYEDEKKEIVKARSKDSDDILATALGYLRRR